MSKTIAITGVAGFIGSHLADRLVRDGYRVFGIDDLSQGLLTQVNPAVEFIRMDIRSGHLANVLRGVDTVFHLAAKNCLSDCEKDPVGTMDINVRGTANVFESAVNAGVRKVVYAESASVYEGTDVFPTPESETSPKSTYAISKYATHLLAQNFGHKTNVRFTGLRYFNVFGPRQDYRRSDRPIMTEFILQLLIGERPILFGEGKRSKDYIYVDDINDFHLMCIDDVRTNNQTFNLGTGKETTFAEVLRYVQELLGTQVEPEQRPALNGGVMRTLANSNRARALGWEPKTSMEDGLRASIDFIRESVLPKFEKVVA